MDSSDPAHLQSIRNIGIIAHIDAGKTTTTERILYYTGEIHRMGDVDKGSTTTDYLEEERERGITIVAAAITCRWKDVTINIIDTPGHVDFTAEVERSLRVLDGAVVIFSAVEGVEAQSETVWRQATKYHVPRLCFINKMDRIGAEFDRVFTEIQDRLESHPIPLQIPIGAGPEGTMGEFQGLIDLITMKALHFKTEDLGSTFTEGEIPEDLLPNAQLWRERMVDSLADFDEPFAEAYMAHLEGAELTQEQIIAGLRRATLTGRAQPVLCGSSFKYVGVQQLLNAVSAYLPSPLDRPPVVGHHPKKGTEVVRKPSPDEPFCGLVFKITNDQHGDLSFVRIYSGELKSGSRVYNPGRDKKENCSRLYHIRADDREKVERAESGDIVGVVGLKDSVTGDTLCDSAHPILLEKIEFPETVISMSIEPVSSADKGKLADTLGALAREDPTFSYKVNEETGQTLISGMGELHLEILKNRMIRDFKLKVHVGRPRVSYRETVKKAVKRVQGVCIRQTGGSGLYAKVTIDLEPETQPKGAPVLAFVNRLKGGVIPGEFLGAIEAGIREEAKSGGRTGFPLVDLKVTLIDGDTHDVDSNEHAFRFAAADALSKAVQEAGAVLLEPIMKLEVVTPEDYLGNITGDLSSRRALIDKTFTRGKLMVVEARAPLEKMFGYSTAVRSLSQGRASYSMEPLEYAAAPDSMLESLAGG
ncbi:elongation factor G [Singulisphaera acidiphila]|uniref:Elongation factor G n=1 Tax=Singulisphaera acidiphila (strain ATCC BAA-1392 / DSM 18658 / VKM B-2454 / MOB10) TaxID=886293 RepID=L0D7Y6_SINAD|nr:elongation factor G [Singulisphaera acidiphila]AGA24923.1 translation elongation factor EF-G [Singulisphaera acidiphila DSM 18658]